MNGSSPVRQLHNPHITYGLFRRRPKGNLFGMHEHGALWFLMCGALEKHLFIYLLTYLLNKNIQTDHRRSWIVPGVHYIILPNIHCIRYMPSVRLFSNLFGDKSFAAAGWRARNHLMTGHHQLWTIQTTAENIYVWDWTAYLRLGNTIAYLLTYLYVRQRCFVAGNKA